MPRLVNLAVPIFLLITTTGSPAREVTSVSVSTPVTVGVQATITVKVTAPCSGVKIDFGDGQSQSYPIVPPQQDYYYEWTAPGPKTVTATGINDCTGQASTAINVQNGGGSLGELCQVVDGARQGDPS